ncbi:flippase-like domain-containing protein [Aureispira anguillae]|uniref:Flippase-like domain-containing protein n=2 Tax=Aureispira anguillae TaxID=2864201 RepID=A0A915Y9D1_9BACT|nr:flippase-like domain-containing protein [Aureispira anguillae]BDS09353.1 flippase-like domain-containing protein [Aureispira anguillae]
MLTNITRTLTIKDKGFSLKSLIQHKFFALLLKLTIVIVLSFILYHQIFGREDITIQKLVEEFVARMSWQNIPLIMLVLVLMPLNWFFETQKWRWLMQKIEPITLGEALRIVLVGLTFSLFTPNRVGEYGGRIMMVSKEKRLMAIFAIMVGASSQWIVLVVGGWWAMIATFYWGFIPVSNMVLGILITLGLLIFLILLLVYFNLPVLVNFCLRFRWTKKWAGQMQQSLGQPYTNQELLIALVYSSTRYLIYSFQYLCLLYFFGFEAGIISTFLGIQIVYLLQTGIPLPPSTGLLARGNLALLIFGYLTVSSHASTAILASTFGLWLINVVLPALIGAFFILKFGWDNKKKKEQLVQEPCSSH